MRKNKHSIKEQVDVPFVKPQERNTKEFIWKLSHGFIVVKDRRNKLITVFDSSYSAVATFTVFKALNTGRKAYRNADSDRQKEWGKVLCSAAILD